MSCIPASHSMNTILSQVDSQMEESPAQRRGSRAYQIFPETNMSEESDYPEDFVYRRERLPSIVVEPTEHSEQESGELCWPLGHPMSNNVEEEEDENTSVDPIIESSVDGEQQEYKEEGNPRHLNYSTWGSSLPLTWKGHSTLFCLRIMAKGSADSHSYHFTLGNEPPQCELSVARKSSIGPSQSQLSLFRLTPPASPTIPDAAPPCLRS